MSSAVCWLPCDPPVRSVQAAGSSCRKLALLRQVARAPATRACARPPKRARARAGLAQRSVAVTVDAEAHLYHLALAIGQPLERASAAPRGAGRTSTSSIGRRAVGSAAGRRAPSLVVVRPTGRSRLVTARGSVEHLCAPRPSLSSASLGQLRRREASRPSRPESSRSACASRRSRWPTCTGIRIVRPLFASPRWIAWRIQKVA